MRCQRDPEQTIPASQPRALLLSLVDGELLAEGEILEDERLMATQEKPNQAKQTRQRRKHG